MITRTVSTLMAALVALAPTLAVAQMPPGMPNIEELMRQQGMGGAGRPPAGRGGGSATPAPPGVPVPPDSPLIAAFQRLDAATAYRVRMEMATTDPRAQQAMKQMGGMDHFDKAMVKPDTQSITFHMNIPAMDLPGKSDDWDVRSVIKGQRMARKFDTPAKARILALQEASVAKQLAMADMYAAMSLAEAAAGPFGAISAAVMVASTVLSHAEAASALKKGRDFFEWTCADRPASATAKPSPDSVAFTDLVDLGERVDGDVPVHGYQFFVREQGQYHGPVEVDIARVTGLPTRFVMSEPSMGATMTMRYSDYDRPATIETPSCLAK